jgi:TonB family protein
LTVAASSEASQQAPSTTPAPQQVAPNADKDIWYAPDVYDNDSPGVTPAALVRETKPDYPSEAMRARIEGVVRLEAIVETNGSVGSIRVRHSLDSVKGLDDSAVKTLRKWRFVAAKKDGVPVRSRISVDISFFVRGGGYRPEVGWPTDFQVSRTRGEMAKDPLAEDVVPIGNVLIRLKHPRDWVVVKGISTDQSIAVQRIDSREGRACTLVTPKESDMDLMVPVRNEVLHAFEKSLRSEMPAGQSGTELKRVGQIDFGHLWIWAEIWRQGIDVSSVPSVDRAAVQSSFEGMRIWRFTTRQPPGIKCRLLRASTPRLLRGRHETDGPASGRRLRGDSHWNHRPPPLAFSAASQSQTDASPCG